MKPAPAPTRFPDRRLLGLLCAGLFLAGLLALAWWSHGGLQRRELLSFLPQPGGLAKGSPVTLQGITIGRVSDLRLAERSGRLGVELRFWVSSSQVAWLHEDARVTAVADLVGPARLVLQPGTAAAGALPPGAELPGTLAPDALSQLLELQPAAKRLIEETETLVAHLDAHSAQIDPVLAGLSRELVGMHETQEQLRSVLREAHGLFVQAAADELAMTSSFTRIADSMNTEFFPRIGRTLDENDRRLADLFASLQRTTGTVEQRLPRLLELSEDALRNSRDVSEAAAHTWPFSRYLKKRGLPERPPAR